MVINVVIGLVVQLLVPLVLIVSLWRSTYKSKIGWLVPTLAYGAFIGYIVLIGSWGFFSYYLRPLPILGFLAAALLSLRRSWGAPWWRSPGSLRGWTSLAVSVLLLLLFSTFLFSALRGLSPGDERSVALSFPLKDGVSYVAHGGASPVMNYHNVDPAQRYALDIEMLNAAGTRASGLMPRETERYAVFGAEISSPCTGEVVEARDSLADLTPPQMDPENLAGNHVVVRCAEEDVDVLLAHMQEGSVAVEEGEDVEDGQLLGRVGNTGNTSEPHLHIHAVRTGSGGILKGEGAPLRFDGRFLVRNSLIFR